MKQLFALAILLASTIWCPAQDIILKTDGDTIHCKIIEAGASDIIYKQNGEQKTIRSKNYITYARNFTNAARSETKDATITEVKGQIDARIEESTTAGDHLIKSGKLTVVAVVVTALAAGAAFGLAQTDTDQEVVNGVLFAGVGVASILQALSVKHKIDAGKKLNQNDSSLPNK